LAILLSCTGVNITSEHQPQIQFPLATKTRSSSSSRHVSYTTDQSVPHVQRSLSSGSAGHVNYQSKDNVGGEREQRSVEQQFEAMKHEEGLGDVAMPHKNSVAPTDIKINGLRFVGYPLPIEQCTRPDLEGFDQIHQMNLTFVIRATCEANIVQSYYNLTRKISYAIMNEERRCGYLRKEMALWKAYQVKMIEYRAENGNSYQEKQYRKTMVRSQLGEQLKMCYDVLHGRREGIKDIHINKVAVGIGDLTKAISPLAAARLSILPFHTILVPSKDDFIDGLSQLPLDHSATVNRAMKYFTETKAIVDISHDADILMSHLQEVGGHLVQQGAAKVIHPIFVKSKYRINPNASIRPLAESHGENSAMAKQFAMFVESSQLPFVTILEIFRETITVGDVCTRLHMLEQRTVVNIIKWLLERNIIQRQHTFLYFMCPESIAQSTALPSSLSADVSSLVGSVESPQSSSMPAPLRRVTCDLPEWIRSDEERAAIGQMLSETCRREMTSERAKIVDFLDPDAASEYFVELAKKYFDGKTPVEAIIFYENIADEALEVYFDIFQEFIFRTEHEDPWVEETNQMYNAVEFMVK